ncbi:MAG: hypothetical protein ACT4OZ_03645 [Gemmatimonadota bacterium]
MKRAKRARSREGEEDEEGEEDVETGGVKFFVCQVLVLVLAVWSFVPGLDIYWLGGKAIGKE